MNIDELPPEILYMIVNYLPFHDRVSFRNVCYRFWELVDIDILMNFKYPFISNYNNCFTWDKIIQHWNIGVIDYMFDKHDILNMNTELNHYIISRMMEYNSYDLIKYLKNKDMTLDTFLKIDPFGSFEFCNSHQVVLLIDIFSNIEFYGEKIPLNYVKENIHHIRDRIIYENDEYMLNTLLSYFEGLTIKDVFPSWYILKKCIKSNAVRVFRYAVDINLENRLSDTCILSALKGYYIKDF